MLIHPSRRRTLTRTRNPEPGTRKKIRPPPRLPQGEERRGDPSGSGFLVLGSWFGFGKEPTHYGSIEISEHDVRLR